MFIDIICKRAAKHVFQDGGKHTKTLLSSTVVCHIEKKESIDIQMLVSSPFLLVTPSFMFCYDLI